MTRVFFTKLIKKFKRKFKLWNPIRVFVQRMQHYALFNKNISSLEALLIIKSNKVELPVKCSDCKPFLWITKNLSHHVGHKLVICYNFMIVNWTEYPSLKNEYILVVEVRYTISVSMFRRSGNVYVIVIVTKSFNLCVCVHLRGRSV